MRNEGGKVLKRVEQEFGGKIEEILESVGKDYKQLHTLADALGVSYQVVCYWIERRLKVKKEDFYRKIVCKSNCIRVEVKGEFRFRFEDQLQGGCRCKTGINSLVIRIQPDDLKRVCQEAGWNISPHNSHFTVNP